jgi:hypothetical protein
MATLRLKPSFDPKRLTWSRPDSRIAPFCSICSAHMPEDEDDPIPVMMWDDKGACVHFCQKCVEEYFEVVK